MKYKANILVVDDETSVCKSIANALQTEGYSVDAVQNAEEALIKETKTKYAVALIDLVMPGLTGIELLEKMKEQNPNITVIMITGYPSIKTAVQAIKSGAFDYIPKPFTPAELRAMVARALGRRHYYEEIAAKVGTPVEKLVEMELPPNRYCIPEHSWVKTEPDGSAKIGIHHNFLRSICNITSIEFPEENETKYQGEVCLQITDSRSQVHSLWTPISGKILEVNKEIKNNFRLLAQDPYDDGWLLAIEPLNLEEEMDSLKPLTTKLESEYYIP
jgi:FixJ family two-component response regulator/glycine cleavage system H lipoate-binding protein